jgi:hypothetical protein
MSSDNPLAQMLVGAIFGYAYRTQRESSRQAEHLFEEGLGQTSNLPKQFARFVEGVLSEGGKVMQRRMGNVVEVLIQDGTDQLMRYMVPIDETDTYVVDTEDATVGVVDLTASEPDEDGIIEADFEPM